MPTIVTNFVLAKKKAQQFNFMEMFEATRKTAIERSQKNAGWSSNAVVTTIYVCLSVLFSCVGAFDKLDGICF